MVINLAIPSGSAHVIQNPSQLLYEAYEILYEEETNVYINNPSHMTKMATMPIYGKYPNYFSFVQ